MPEVASEVQRPTVLLVDDDRLILASISQVLRDAGFPTQTVCSGAEAIEHCRDAPPDIVVIDYDMPEISGLEVARSLQPAPFPMVFLTAYGDETIVSAAADLGVMTYLVKPVSPQHLVPTIHMAVRRFSEMNSLRGTSAQLNEALRGSRATSVVVGLLMERLRMSETQAYDQLRRYCRSNNRKIVEVAEEILGATEQAHATLSAIGKGRIGVLQQVAK